MARVLPSRAISTVSFHRTRRSYGVNGRRLRPTCVSRSLGCSQSPLQPIASHRSIYRPNWPTRPMFSFDVGACRTLSLHLMRVLIGSQRGPTPDIASCCQAGESTRSLWLDLSQPIWMRTIFWRIQSSSSTMPVLPRHVLRVVLPVPGLGILSQLTG